MTDYLAAAMAMLGPAQNRHADPAAWDRLHAELGMQLPRDYRVLVDAFAPIQINGHLYLSHPATERWNLGQDIRGKIQAWSEVSWDDLDLDLDADEDPASSSDSTSCALAPATGCGRSRAPTEERPSSCSLAPMPQGSW
ncbi:hypothetical protein ACFTXM_14390 [Streptomyces sp. NPDC056930]|uniref:hypothetical protein n=1 Tax=Streptomyces sp. NPDC056930 TaxID=3345967 RepID=UPI00362912F5